MNEDELKKARLYALRRLSMQAMYSKSLAQSLMKRGFSEDIVDFVIEECMRLGYLNDQEWTASFVRGQISRKKGVHAIASKFTLKGVDREFVSQILGEVGEVSQQRELIEGLLRSKYHKRNLKDHKEKQKVIASLARRGFDLSLILSVINENRISHKEEAMI